MTVKLEEHILNSRRLLKSAPHWRPLESFWGGFRGVLKNKSKTDWKQCRITILQDFASMLNHHIYIPLKRFSAICFSNKWKILELALKHKKTFS